MLDGGFGRVRGRPETLLFVAQSPTRGGVVTMVETLAYAADRVSYMQDAVNTEAYIGTARSRISMRRHARLVDYQVSEGANARGLEQRVGRY